jgi:hypothetical protein
MEVEQIRENIICRILNTPASGEEKRACDIKYAKKTESGTKEERIVYAG